VSRPPFGEDAGNAGASPPEALRTPPEDVRASSPEALDAPSPAEPETLLTVELLQLAQQGDQQALERVMQRYLPRLQRWARGRLPDYARSLVDTSDLVQETFSRTLHGLKNLEVGNAGGFESYVRQSVLNGIKDQIRRASIRPRSAQEPEELVHRAPSPLENAIGADLLDRYERGMAGLEPEDRRLIHLRVELELEYSEIAALTGRPSRDAARMAFQRALARLTDAMGHEA
jgi:RNA polymerase sigma-70 factor (ECF subfamily)